MSYFGEKDGVKTFDIGKYQEDLNKVLERAEMLAEWFLGDEVSYIEDYLDTNSPGESWCICGGTYDEDGVCSNENCIKLIARSLLSDDVQKEIEEEKEEKADI